MNLAIDVLSNCKVRVLLVPVPPIKKTTFYKYVELVKTFNVVRLGDVTPDLKKGANAMFSSQVFQEGQMHFQFLTHWTRDHAELEDFQPHRRIFGVIGIMDCQEWQDKDLNKASEQFENDLDKYPTAIVTRCFAFDPSETQEDDTKGLIMIPNVGNMSFYMSTMICDFASEILGQFGILANRIEKLQLLESPLPNTIQIPRRERSSPSMSPSSSHITISKRASSYQPSPQSQNSHQHHRFSTNTIHLAGSTGESIRTRKRTPGRVRKLLGDFYLLAGRLPDAVKCYDQAIEMAKITSDFLWIAGAMEGLVCATILLEYLQADVGHIVSRRRTSTPLEGEEQEEQEEEEEIKGGSLSVVLDQYSKIISYYSKVFLTANFGVPDLVYAETCLKLARVLTTAYLNNGWNDKTVQLLLQGRLHDKSMKHGKDILVSSQALMAYKASGIPRYQIAEWVTKIWEINLNHLVLLDQIYVTTAMSTIYSSIGYHRKAAWLMHEGVERMLPLLIQHRRSGLSKNANKMGHDIGVLESLKRICEIYGIGERNVHDGGALKAMQHQNEETHEGMIQQPLPKSNTIGTKHRVENRFGWPEIQIDILKQCMSVSEALLDHGARLYYTTVLLKNLYKYIPKADQIKLAASIQSMVVVASSSSSASKDKNYASSTDSINYWGVNIVSRIVAKQPISRKAVHAHPMKEDINKVLKETNDPFIYNPFAKKENSEIKVVLIKNEVSEFKVTLVNPFGFDLELQSISLSTSGIAFNAISTALTIPANATVHVPLTGIPEETGTLVIRGCKIQIIGFVEQEFLVEDATLHKEALMNDGIIKTKQSGLNAMKATRKRELSNENGILNYYNLNVIEDQPLLKIKKTSLLHGAVMLFEGEMTHIILELENIGNIPVDFITLSFADSTTTNTLINPEIPPEEQYEVELYTKGTRVFSWEGTTEKSNGFVGKQIWLPPGSTTSIKVNVYGKRDCQGGTIQIDYGYLDRAVKEMVQEETTATFYTRQLYLNVLITVYQHLEPCNWDIVYLRHSTPASKEALESALNRVQQHTNQSTGVCFTQEQPVEDLLLLTKNTQLEKQERNDYCLALFDIRNTWTASFDIHVSVGNKIDGNTSQLRSGMTIHPGSTKRMILPLKRLFLPPETCQQEIPSFDPNKQFVVSQGPKISEEQQAKRLQMFWYREELLNRMKATWVDPTTGRSGQLNLRSSLRLTPMQLSILKKEDVEFIVELTGKSVQKKSHRKFSCACNNYVKMTVSIKNQFSHPIKIILRIQPVQSYNDGVKEYDLSDKLLMEGVQQVVMPEIPAMGGVVSHSIPMYFLSRGQFELLYHAEDVHSRSVYYDQEWATIDVADHY